MSVLLSQFLSTTIKQTETKINELLAPSLLPEGRIIEAIRYSSLNGGKRLRPFILISTSEIFEVPKEYAIRAAASLEMVHCYSLIHDDLPCMDNDDLRRGIATCHKKYDEATAVLAGDGLLTKAFEVLANEATHPKAEIRLKLIEKLSLAAGAEDGMISGQMLDMLAEDMPKISLDEIIRLQQKKTGALIKYACEAGAILGSASKEDTQSLLNYGEKIGLAFQITDDILDIEGTTESLGKTAGKDIEEHKATFVSLLGMNEAKEKAYSLIDAALEDLKSLEQNTEKLELLAKYIIERKN